MSAIGDTRLYAVAIALVSGAYSIASAFVGAMGVMPMSDTIMLVIGVVVLVHGIVLLTPLAGRLGRASGALMVLWAGIMVGNQLLTASMSASGMASWDAGMIALAVLMFFSGLIMSRGQGTM